MIQIICDRCERPFEVTDDLAGGKVECPYCEDVNRVPDEPLPSAPPVSMTAPVASPPPPTDAAPADEAERELAVVRPAMFRAHPFRYLVIVLLGVGGLTLGIAALTSTRVWPWLAWPGFLLTAAAAGWWLSWYLSSNFWIRITISNKRTVRYEGVVRRHSTEVLHDHVRSVDIQQSFVQRLMNVGYIGIDSAGQDGIEIEIRDIPGPFEVKKLIDAYRKM